MIVFLRSFLPPGDRYCRMYDHFITWLNVSGSKSRHVSSQSWPECSTGPDAMPAWLKDKPSKFYYINTRRPSGLTVSSLLIRPFSWWTHQCHLPCLLWSSYGPHTFSSRKAAKPLVTSGMWPTGFDCNCVTVDLCFGFDRRAIISLKWW